MREINYDKIHNIINGCIDILNAEEYTEQEVIVIMSQILIKVGIALYDPQGTKFTEGIDWAALNRQYYSDKNVSVGMGLMLNGGAIMSALGEETLEQLQSTYVDGENNYGNNLPNSDQVSQEIGRDAVRPEKTGKGNGGQPH